MERALDQRVPSAAARSEGASLALPAQPSVLAAALGVAEDSLRAAGEERYARQAYDSAAAIWRVEIARTRQNHDTAAEARARMWLGLAAWHLGDFKSARFEGETSVALKRKLRLDAELSRSFNALGLLAWHEGRYGDALTLFDSAIASAKRNNDAPGIARAVSNVPLVEVELGHFDSARIQFAHALQAGRETTDDRVEGNALANLAMLEIRLGNGAKAVPLLAQARAHYAKLDYRPGESNALGQLATAWSELGDLQKAIASADSGLVIARAEGDQQEVASTLEVLADLYAQAGDLKRSLQILRGADSLDASMGLALEQGTNQRRIGSILGELGETGPSITHAGRAVEIHRKVKARNEESYDLMQLAYSLSLSGDTARAAASADSALKLAIDLRNPAATRDAAGIAAHLALRAGRAKEALVYLERAAQSQARDDWRLADLRAVALFQLGRLTEARTEGERSLSGLERERASLGFGPLRAGYLASRSAPFSHLIEIDLARGDTAAAFDVAASLPGRALAERLGAVEGAASAIAPTVRREGSLLKIAAIERELDSARVGEDQSEKQRSLERSLESERSTYEEQLNRDASLRGSKSLIAAVPGLASVRRSLRPGDLLQLFVSGPDRLDVFAVSSRGIHHRGIAVGDRALRERVRFAREVMLLGGDRGGGGVPKPLGSLFELLMKPLEATGAFDGARRLLIVANGSLGALPFAALWNGSTGRFLVEDYVIRYLPSLTALSSAGEQPPLTTRGLSVFVPQPDSLPGTRIEARAIAATLPSTVTFFGSAATEAKFRSALRQGRAVHVASHGSLNAQNPLFSRMIVGSRLNGPSNDGRLEVHEILGLTTRSPLVFLSGCETAMGAGGLGAFGEGSEEGSLAQAFLIAGARTVVATLWRIDDANAAGIAASFYRNLSTGAPPDQALALAQRKALTNRRSYTWAAYDLFGRPAM